VTLQAKLARALQEKQFEPIGASRARKADARIIAASKGGLEKEVAAGHLREGLFYRLNVISLHLPPLRERGTDVLLLAELFLSRFCAARERKPPMLSSEAQSILVRYAWPGNIRELEGVMERICVTASGDVIGPGDIPGKIRNKSSKIGTIPADLRTAKHAGFNWPNLADLTAQNMGLKEFLDEVETRLLTEALTLTKGSQSQVAEILKIKRTTLIEKLKKRNM